MVVIFNNRLSSKSRLNGLSGLNRFAQFEPKDL